MAYRDKAEPKTEGRDWWEKISDHVADGGTAKKGYDALQAEGEPVSNMPMMSDPYTYRPGDDYVDEGYDGVRGASSIEQSAGKFIRENPNYTPGYGADGIENPEWDNFATGHQVEDPMSGRPEDARAWRDYMIGRDPNYVNQQADQAYHYGEGGAKAVQAFGNELRGMGGAYAGEQLAQARGFERRGDAALGVSAPQIRATPADFGLADDALRTSTAYGSEMAGVGRQSAIAQRNIGDSLMGLESREGPSAAQAQLQLGANASMDQAMAIARSGRGYGGSAQGLADAQRSNAATMANTSNQAAVLRAQEQAAWRQRQASNLGTGAAINNAAGAQSLQGLNAAANVNQQTAQQRSQNTQFAANQAYNQEAQNAALTLQNRSQQNAAAGQLYGLAQTGQQGAANTQADALKGAATMYATGTGLQFAGQNVGIGLNQAQNQTDLKREEMLTQEYGVQSGIGIAGAQMAQQQQAADNAMWASMIAAGASAMSDVRSKKDIARSEVDLRPAQGYEYEYIDPARHGQGRYSGPMAQDLLKSRGVDGAVVRQADGKLGVNTDRLSLSTASGLGQEQRRVDDLEARFAELESMLAGKKPASRAPSAEATRLSEGDERSFQAWAKRNNVRDVDHADSHYDYRGYWQENPRANIRGGVDHFPDTYKQHGHPTFSTESRYSQGRGDGGNWLGEEYFPGVPGAHEPAAASAPMRDVDTRSLDYSYGAPDDPYDLWYGGSPDPKGGEGGTVVTSDERTKKAASHRSGSPNNAISFDYLDSIGTEDLDRESARQEMLRRLAPENLTREHKAAPQKRDKAFYELEEESDHVLQRGERQRDTSPVRAFGRAAKEAFVNGVAAPGQLMARALGASPQTLENMSAEHLFENLSDEGVTEHRQQRAAERRYNPDATGLGEFGGDVAAGAATAGAAGLALNPAARRAAMGAIADMVPVRRAGESAEGFARRIRRMERGAVNLGGAQKLPPVDTSRELLPGSGGRTESAKEAGRFLDKHPDSDAIRGYMGSDYADINNSLRWGVDQPRRVHPSSSGKSLSVAEPAETYTQQGARIKRALEDAERAGHSQPGLVTRGIELPELVINKWRKAGAIDQQSVWSTSSSSRISQLFSDNGTHKPVLLRIRQRDAVPVSGIPGQSAFEDELLLAPGKKWKIVGEEKGKAGLTIFDLEQVDSFEPGVKPVISFNEPRSRQRAV